MRAPRPSADPPRELVRRLRDARQRGMSFDDAWAAARPAITFPHDTTSRTEWRLVLDQPEVRREFEAAYVGEPTTLAVALREWQDYEADEERPEDEPCMSARTLGRRQHPNQRRDYGELGEPPPLPEAV